ncbi:DUF2461 domain-containing protein [Altibacter sp. HG106]|uniref:DUF2461 domain-containing protein n=1 Tax=Altibacter sp. HG106 TaxID=3023937 RepID=UPI00235006F1|nr:DUF2461 domain-containing protein [Altibacter sp. HG106]MDC7994590.1 DUF2461 domain-containing protein [Altibacter sp. HG106]
MNFNALFSFLERLVQHNSTDWMDDHRSEYHDIRDDFIAWLDQMNLRLAQLDPDYFDTPGKKAINRINNNLMFHPNRPVYKDHFGAGLDQVSKQGDFYLHFGVEACFIGGGYWHPNSKLLRSIRQAIDYNGNELQKILDTPSFKKMFGSLVVDDPLKTAPKGFSQDHEHINLLRRKSFAVTRPLNRTEIVADNFEEVVVEIYKEMLPFRRYLNQAVTV